MSMPFKFADSENPAMILPVVGQIHPRLSSSISGTRAASGRLVSAGAFAADGELAPCGAEPRGSEADALRGSAAATTGADSRNWAKACSEYGTLTARGSVLTVAEFGRLLGTADGGGRASPPLGTTGGALTSGEVTTPPSVVVPGAASASTCPTRITFMLSMLFQAAS